MTPDEWFKVFAGNPDKIESECARITQLRDLLWSAAPPEIDSWTGVAADGYRSTIAGVVGRCREAAESHDDALNALEAFKHVLTTLRSLAWNALAEIRQAPQSIQAAAAYESLPRWRDQLDAGAQTAAIAVEAAAAQLELIRPLLPELENALQPAPASPPAESLQEPSSDTEPPPPVESRPRTDLISMLQYAQQFTVPGRLPVSSWVIWQQAPGRQIGRFGADSVTW